MGPMGSVEMMLKSLVVRTYSSQLGRELRPRLVWCRGGACSQKEEMSVCHAVLWQKVFQAEGMTSANALGQECAWRTRAIERRPLWLEQSKESGKEQEERSKKSEKLEAGMMQDFCVILKTLDVISF